MPVSFPLIVAVCLLVKWKDLLLHSFDPAQARVSGLSVNLLHYGLLTLLSLTIVATLSAAGLILAIGLLIAPGAIAFLLVRKIQHNALGRGCRLHELNARRHPICAFFLDSAPAPTIILILTRPCFLSHLLARSSLSKPPHGKPSQDSTNGQDYKGRTNT